MISLHFSPTKGNSFFILVMFILTTLQSVAQEQCAIPVAELVVEKQQPDGSKVTLKQMGNPFLHYYETIDGFTVVKDATDDYFKYAIHSSNGNLQPDAFIAKNPLNRTTEESGLLANKPKHLRYKGKELEQRTKEAHNFKNPLPTVMKRASGDTDRIIMSTPVTSGTFKHLVLLIDFQDYPFSNSRADFDDMLNQIGYNGNGQRGSFKDYYLDTSYGNLSVETTVVGWYTAQHDISYYGYNEDLSFPFNAPELVREAVDAAEAAGVDFSQFDNDGDGNCDLVTIGHAGPGAETIGYESQYIWSHKSGLGNARKVTYDGVVIDQYTMNPETPGGETNKRLTDIGIYVHEFGHALGLPDLYDFATSNGAGRWCSMSWSSNQRSPIEFNPHFKEKLGWMTPIVLEGTGSVTNMPSTNDSSTYYRINTSYPWEYYLLANMQKTEWNSQIPNSGLMVWHIDSSQRNNTNVSRLHVVPEQADGRQDLQQPPPGGNYWDGGDPYPGVSGNTSFNTSSNPNSNLNDGTLVNMSITNINEESGLISFNYSDGSNKASQTISFDAISDKTYGDANFSLTANATSSLPISYEVVEGPITISNDVVTISGAGMARITAAQGGNETYNAAEPLSQSFMINKADQIINITPIADKLTTDSPFDILATVDTGLMLTYQITGPATLINNRITLNGVVGTVEVNVSQAGNSDYLPTMKTLIFQVQEVPKTEQAIDFEIIMDKTYGDEDFRVRAISSSGLPVQMVVENEFITLESGIVSILGAGNTSITASQDGDENYAPATPVTHQFTIDKATQAITIEAISDQLVSAAPIQVNANVDSGLPLVYEVQGPANVSDSMLTLDGKEAPITLIVYQEGNENYEAAQASITFNVVTEAGDFTVSVYPNPVSNVLNIDSAGELYIRLFNMDGKVLMTKKIQSGSINLSAMAQGIYMLEMVDGKGGIHHKKIIKKE